MILLGWILGWAAAHPVHPLDTPLLEAEANGEGPLWPQLSRSEGHMQVYWQEANKQRSSNKLSKVPLKLHASPLS